MLRLAFLFLACSLSIQLWAQTRAQDSLALVALYNSTNGDAWSVDTNWLLGPLDQWHGIFTSDGRVEIIALSNNNLSGVVPPEIGNLTALKNLQMSSNSITGAIPPEIGACQALEMISLEVNSITSIPEELVNCTNLDDIRIYRNEIEGPFPQFLAEMTQLVRLDIGSNKLTGPLPDGLESLVNLRLLAFDRNELSGPLVSMKSMPNLVEVHVDENNFTGNIEDILPDTSNLYYFTCSDNQLSGCMRSTFFKPEQLQFLHFSNNKIDCVGDFSAHQSEGVLTRIWCSRNYLDFDQLIPLAELELPQFTYTPQKPLGTSDTLYREAGESFALEFEPGGTNVSFQWSLNGVDITGATQQKYEVTSFDPGSDEGRYECSAAIDHPMLTDLVLTTASDYIFDAANTSTTRQVVEPITLTPNPCSDYVSLTELPQHVTDLIIYSSVGQKVRHVALQGVSSEISLDIMDLASGSYTVQLLDTDSRIIAIGRLVKSY